MMSPTKTIYFINQSPKLLKVWRGFSDKKKREVIKACEAATQENDLEKIIKEITDGQRRLF